MRMNTNICKYVEESDVNKHVHNRVNIEILAVISNNYRVFHSADFGIDHTISSLNFHETAVCRQPCDQLRDVLTYSAETYLVNS